MLWTLTAWTALCALALIFGRGEIASVVSAGMTHDPAGRRLLGVQVLVLGALYGYAALRPREQRVFAWLPLTAQTLTALVILFNVVAGASTFGDAWFAFTVAAVFAILLSAFHLAGEPALQPRRDATSKPDFSNGGSLPGATDARTQRLFRTMDTINTPPPAAEPPEERDKPPQGDDSILGA